MDAAKAEKGNVMNDMCIANRSFADSLRLELARLEKEHATACIEMRRTYEAWKGAHEAFEYDPDFEAEAWKVYDDASNWHDKLNDAIYHIKELIALYC